MKLKVTELRDSLRVEIRGDEPWLGFIYESFGQREVGKGPLVTGHFTVAPGDYGVFTVKGLVRYTPKVPCGRCQDGIDWLIERDIDVRFLSPFVPEEFKEEDEEGEEERDLEPEDLDSYYIEKGVLDIEQVLNDLIQTSLPQRLVKATPDGKSCLVCLADLQERMVYEDKQAKDTNPFAVLKNLKLPEN